MVRSDRYKKRPIVLRYWQYKDAIQPYRDSVEWEPFTAKFIIRIPKSWSKKKKLEMNGTPHKQTPDLDNLIKGLWDCLLDDDSAVWHIKHASKVWGIEPAIILNSP